MGQQHMIDAAHFLKRQIARAKAPAVNPLGYLGRFFRQPRLIAGWFFAVMRSCGWWVYVVYLPIFCIEAGLGDMVGSTALAVSNAVLFLAPAINRWARRAGVRRSVRPALGIRIGGSGAGRRQRHSTWRLGSHRPCVRPAEARPHPGREAG